jgi:hypothetical protein
LTLVSTISWYFLVALLGGTSLGPPVPNFYEYSSLTSYPKELQSNKSQPPEVLSLYGRRMDAYNRAVNLIKEEKFQEALTFITKQSLEIKSWSGVAALEAGLLSVSKPEAALKIYDKLLNAPKKDLHWARALAGYRYLIKNLSDRGDFSARARLIRCLAFEWRNLEALSLLESTLSLENLPEVLRKDLEAFGAVLALRIGLFEKARAFWLGRSDLSSLRWLSTLLLREGKFLEAAVTREKVFKSLKGNRKNNELIRVFDILTKGGLYEEALGFFENNPDLKELNPAWAFQLGLAAVLSGNIEESLKLFSAEDRQKGERGQKSLYFHGRALEMLNRQPEAALLYEKVTLGPYNYYRILAEGRLNFLNYEPGTKAVAESLARLLKNNYGDSDSLGYFLWLNEKVPLPFPDLISTVPRKAGPGEAARSKAAIDHYLSLGNNQMALEELVEAVESLVPNKVEVITPEITRWIILAASSGNYGLAVRILSRVKGQSGIEYSRWNHPLVFSRPVLAAWHSYGLAPQVTLAVIRTESAFQSTAISSSNARGLMQILPSTAIRIANNLGDAEPREEDLFIPELNIRYGTWYLSKLKENFGELTLALAAYNGGPFNIQKFMESRKGVPLDLFIETIPLAETSAYVKKVLEAKYLYEVSYLGKGDIPDLTRIPEPLKKPPLDF